MPRAPPGALFARTPLTSTAAPPAPAAHVYRPPSRLPSLHRAQTQGKFNELHAALVPELEKLDGVLAELLSNSFRAFMERQLGLLRQQVDNYSEALSGVPAPVAEGEAASGEASADAAPAAEAVAEA